MDLGHGIDYWNMLPPSLITKEIKALVNKDPDLSDETLAAIIALQPEKQYSFDFCISKTHIGVSNTAVSMCILDNLHATMGELVARYAEVHNIPYSACAVALCGLRKRDELYILRKKRGMKLKLIKWHPSNNNFVAPPAKKTSKNQITQSHETLPYQPVDDTWGTALPPAKRVTQKSPQTIAEAMILATPPKKKTTKPLSKKDKTSPRHAVYMGTLSEEEYNAKKRAGIEKSVAEGRNGRNKISPPQDFFFLYEMWNCGELSARKAATIAGVSTPTFLRWANQEKERRDAQNN